MSGVSLFVGLVSHEQTTYPQSQGISGLAARVHSGFPGSILQVNTANLSGAVLLTAGMGRRSCAAELRLERQWSSYLGGSAWYRLVLAARTLLSRIPGRGVRDAQAVRRLLDIEYSHRDLMQAGFDSGAPWTLILEDDALCDDVEDLVTGLQGLMASDPAPSYVNLSRSFSATSLRVGHLLAPALGAWQGAEHRSVLVARKPVTNTVCAVAYARPFLERMLPVWDALPIDPVVPIDWKFNAVLMAMYESGSFPLDGCWFVEPAPITQGSLLPHARIMS